MAKVIVLRRFAKKKVAVLIHTRLQPGDRERREKAFR